MAELVQRFPASIDPLVAEARQRARRRRIRIALALAVVLAAVATGLALRSTSTGASGDAPHRVEKGIVTGSIHVVGGPAGVYLRKAGGLVTVWDAKGQVVRRLRVQPDHDFHLRIAPGRYRLTFGRHRYSPGCPLPSIIAVRPGRTTLQNVFLGCDWL